ncbi:hypothetical protein HanXRQr2_Chr14g0637301 [Helianthus annuus]|uniref:Uncharacterized protein n=1 Tax=Helianthus annuus TaxID=4232 RepID=A0A9K3E811_HELAN|nr:hypothetical protein HanXRQr2_Chr14g0637301 [Helianthus annuus]KAJ0819491.1 hypothetical protein HanPSC8_Chr16g0696661 [Helianthus annuus]
MSPESLSDHDADDSDASSYGVPDGHYVQLMMIIEDPLSGQSYQHLN